MKTRKCITKRCTNTAQKGHFKCSKCRTREYMLNEPAAYCYGKLKSNCSQRGINFDLTLDEFTKYATKTRLKDRNGTVRIKYTIKRRNKAHGYTLNNIAVNVTAKQVK